MEKFKFEKDGDEYSTSRGRYFKYYFTNTQEGLLQIGETDDYFYFTIMLREGYLKNNFCLNIAENSVLYPAFENFLKGFNNIEVMEEGTAEKKSIGFNKTESNIEIKFNLTDEEHAFCTIELANLRRLGDTRFAKLIPTTKLNEKDFYEIESSFRYKFKGRIHQLLNELEDICQLSLNNNQ